MKRITILSSAIASLFFPFMQLPSQGTPKLRFVCLPGPRSIPTTYAWNSRGKIALIRWEKTFGTYSPQQRCQEVSPRFQQAYNNGSLKFLTNSYMNGQSVICATKEYKGHCESLIMTLGNNENGQKIVNTLKDNLNGYNVGPSIHTNQVFIEINLDEYLRNAPVETNN
ncbi:MAG: COP23 domain-containing protein [Cyanobacteria bacterium P01_G01_bin.49]